MEKTEKEEEEGEIGKMGAMEEMEKEKEGLEEKTSGGIGDEGKKKKEKEKEPDRDIMKGRKETDREKMEGRKETDNLLPVGGILRGNLFSCLPPGFGIGCPPLPETSQDVNMSTEIPMIILERPSQLRGDGKSFLRWTPLHCYVRAG